MSSNKLLILFQSSLPIAKQHEFIQFLLSAEDTKESQVLLDPIIGKTVTLDIKTSYYLASVDLLLDVANIKDWSDEFINDEMIELREAIDGVVYVFNEINEVDIESLKIVHIFLENEGKDDEEVEPADKLMFAVAVSDERESDVEWEDYLFETGIEFVQMKDIPENEYHEKLGFKRIRELIECYEWDSTIEEEQEEQKQEQSSDIELPKIEKTTDLLDDADLDLTDLLSKLESMKVKIATLDDDKKHEAAMNFINGLLR